MEGDEDQIEDTVRIELVVPDPIHLSGGPFCSYVNLIPIASEKQEKNGSVTIDFISINLYGVVVYDSKLLTTSKFQSTLRLRFLQSERDELQQNQDLSLIFLSDPVVFCTSREFGANFEELRYRFTSLLPPFLPPSFTGKHVSYSYFVYLIVQYRNSLNAKETKTVSKKLEFNVLGSIYQGTVAVVVAHLNLELPILNVKYYPILPKKGGFDLSKLYDLSESECVNIIKTHISDKDSDSISFNFKCRVMEVSQEYSEDDRAQNYLVRRDLDLVWYLWDEFYDSGSPQAKDDLPLLLCFNTIVDTFSNFDYDTDLYKINKYKNWFGNLFPQELHKREDLDSEGINTLLRVFLKKLELRMCSYYKIKLEDLKRTTIPPNNDSLCPTDEIINFTIDRKKLCTFTISGLRSVEEGNILEISAGSWFSVHYDMTNSKRPCLKIQLTLQRLESHENHVKLITSTVIEESSITLGKLKGSVNCFIPSTVVPSFRNSFLDVSYRMEVRFFYLPDVVDIFDQNAIKSGLNKLKTLDWKWRVRILRNTSAGLMLDELSDLDKKQELEHSAELSKNKLSSFMFTNKSQLYRIIKI
ncbi:hypothetical protein MACK_000250 [Theileria orientalis]|uniref:Uncharacterized protein n=1 Tax=Theileria orientalis TaxID=68886 RepID=A0A976M952_THEOR|nr:hypothetical protein MACK_000250 [Theileria orientalis]